MECEPPELLMLKIGIVGLAQVGKTTLFRILTQGHADPSPGRAETHVGVAHVPDERLDRLTDLYKPRKEVPASVEYVDTPGSVIEIARTGSQAQALREAAALAHVVRAFEDPTTPAPAGSLDPRRD